jgi:hypothetical protein
MQLGRKIEIWAYDGFRSFSLSVVTPLATGQKISVATPLANRTKINSGLARIPKNLSLSAVIPLATGHQM